MTLWSGRFSSGMDDGLWDLSESYSFDHVLYPYDIRGSKAHVAGLVRAGLLSAEEGTTLTRRPRRGLGGVRRAIVSSAPSSDEDIHMAIERRVTELAGRRGSEAPHGAQSQRPGRHDVSTLHACDAITGSPRTCLDLVDVLVGLGERNARRLSARATPTCNGRSRSCSATTSTRTRWSLLRDVDRLLDAEDRMNVSPLGAGALAGTSLPIDPRGRG